MLISLLKMQNIIICSVWLHCWNLIPALDFLVCVLLKIALPAVKSWSLHLMYFITHTQQPSQDFHTSNTTTTWNRLSPLAGLPFSWGRPAHSLVLQCSCFIFVISHSLGWAAGGEGPCSSGHLVQEVHQAPKGWQTPLAGGMKWVPLRDGILEIPLFVLFCSGMFRQLHVQCASLYSLFFNA